MYYPTKVSVSPSNCWLHCPTTDADSFFPISYTSLHAGTFITDWGRRRETKLAQIFRNILLIIIFLLYQPPSLLPTPHPPNPCSLGALAIKLQCTNGLHARHPADHPRLGGGGGGRGGVLPKSWASQAKPGQIFRSHFDLASCRRVKEKEEEVRRVGWQVMEIKFSSVHHSMNRERERERGSSYLVKVNLSNCGCTEPLRILLISSNQNGRCSILH